MSFIDSPMPRPLNGPTTNRRNGTTYYTIYNMCTYNTFNGTFKRILSMRTKKLLNQYAYLINLIN